jgi:hypothetical protein
MSDHPCEDVAHKRLDSVRSGTRELLEESGLRVRADP